MWIPEVWQQPKTFFCIRGARYLKTEYDLTGNYKLQMSATKTICGRRALDETAHWFSSL
jgi:hypothetical protein